MHNVNMTHFGVTYCTRVPQIRELYDAPLPRAASLTSLPFGQNARDCVRTLKWAAEDTCCVVESGYDWNVIVIVR